MVAVQQVSKVRALLDLAILRVWDSPAGPRRRKGDCQGRWGEGDGTDDRFARIVWGCSGSPRRRRDKSARGRAQRRPGVVKRMVPKAL